MPLPPDLKTRLRDEPSYVRADLESVWALLGAAEDATDAEATPEAAWDAIVQRHPELDTAPENGTRPDRDDRPAQRSQRSGQALRRRWRVVAGLALAMLVLAGGLWLWRQPETTTAPAGQQQAVTLPDGSTVDLNSGTTLAYRRGFRAWPFVEADRRTVRLDGEAFFDVAEGTRPFVVRTENARVTVTGTRFNVRARRTEASAPATEVTVVGGSVRVAGRQSAARSVVLSEPGQVSRVAGRSAGPTAPASASVQHVLAWRDHGFAARAQPLTAVLQDLERRYNVVLHLHDSVERSRAPISLYYPTATDLETILHDLCTARDLNYRPTSRGYKLFAAANSR